VNAAFLTIISVTTGNSYTSGFITCVIYTAVLFLLARYFERSKKENDKTHQQSSVPLIIGLLYGLGVLALGSSGFLFLLVLFGDACKRDYQNDYYGDGDDNYYSSCPSTSMALSNLILAAIPMIAISVALWIKKSIPTSGFTTYVGIAVFGITLPFCFDQEKYYDGMSFYQWWSLITSTLYILALSYLLLSKNNLAKEPLAWGLNTGAFVFFCSMFAVVNIVDNENIWKWMLINVCSFLPLILLGLVTDQSFIVFLGACGLFIDVLRLTSVLPDAYYTQFLALAIAGLGIAALGMWLKKHQSAIRDPCVAWFESHSPSWMKPNDAEDTTEHEAESYIEENALTNYNTKAEGINSSESSDIFSWIGGIIVNISFFAIITLSIGDSWIYGCITCVIYTIVLFLLARYFERSNNAENKDDASTYSSIKAEIGSTQVNTAPATIVGLLYGLGILALGASGWIFGTNLFEGQMMTFANLFLTAIPMIAISVALWVKKSIPTSGFTTYVGIALFGITLTSYDSGIFYQWWSLITSTLYILALSYLLLSKNNLAKEPLAWGLNTGAFVFFCSMFAVVNIFDNENPLWKWMLINVCSFLPLILLGLVTDQKFIVFLGACGLFIDVLRFTEDMDIIFQSLILAIAGLGIAALGMWLKKHQSAIRDPCVAWFESRSPSWMNANDALHPIENIAQKHGKNEYDLMV